MDDRIGKIHERIGEILLTDKEEKQKRMRWQCHNMMLESLLRKHKENFRRKVVASLASKYEMSEEEVIRKYEDAIEHFVRGKYEAIEDIVRRLIKISEERPLLLNIRRDPCSDDVCMICERDRPNIEELKRIYADRIAFYEIYDSSPEVLLYHIINQGRGESLLPLNAIIYGGEVVKFWTGRPVSVDEYRECLDDLVS